MSDLLPLAQLDTGLRAAALALLGVLGLLALRARVRRPLGRVTAALAAGLALQLLATAPPFAGSAPGPVAALLAAVSVGNAVVFWWFAKALVDPRFALRRTDAGIWATVAGLALLHCALVLGNRPALALPTALAVRLLPLMFAVLALRRLLAHATVDDPARRMGLLVVGGGVAYVMSQQLLRLGQPGGRLVGPQAAADAAMLLALLAVVAWRALRLDADGPWALRSETAAATPSVTRRDVTADAERPVVVERTTRPAPIDAAANDRLAALADDHLLAALEQLMTAQHAYRDEGLGIATLAARLNAPEYRLRRLINGRLGHRNFNAYLNGLRLADARAALADPARRSLPVLSIALGSGFQSIGPFNRAFKADTGLTPTEFRRQKLAES